MKIVLDIPIGINFKGISKWKYTQNLKVKGYPYLNEVKLWNMGFVLSIDYNNTYKLHSGKKAKVVWEGKREDLNKI